ncbi:MAG: spore germination protein, partial [Cohnella sp.]|nr:spore germination protein [Cohnella sp.]
MLRRPRKSRKTASADVQDHALEQALEQSQDKVLGNELELSEQFFKNLLGMNNDFIMRRFHVFGRYPAIMCYYANMVDQALINKDILKPFMYVPSSLESKEFEIGQLPDVLMNDAIYHSACKLERKLELLVNAVLQGNTIVIVDGLEDAFLIETRNIDKRSIDTPATEQVIRGPREGFIELLGTNISLLRYRLQTSDLRIRMMEIGRRTKSKVAVCYMEGITNPDLVAEVDKRLSKIDIDAVLDSGYLEQFIEDNNYSPFPQV